MSHNRLHCTSAYPTRLHQRLASSAVNARRCVCCAVHCTLQELLCTCLRPARSRDNVPCRSYTPYCLLRADCERAIYDNQPLMLRMSAAYARRYCTPKKRAMSMKFSPPTMLFAKRMATVVPYATCTHNHTSSNQRSLNSSCDRRSCTVIASRMHLDTGARSSANEARSSGGNRCLNRDGSSAQCRQFADGSSPYLRDAARDRHVD